MPRYTVIQVHDTEADDPLAAALDAEDQSNANTIYRVEDETGSCWEIDTSDGGSIRPITPF